MKKVNNLFFFLLSLFLVFLSCNKNGVKANKCQNNYPSISEEKVSISQGLWGDVWFWRGNFQPVNFGEICPVKRKIFIYELTTLDDVEQIDFTAFYSEIKTKRISSVRSDENGFFQLKLVPGTYSLFIKENGNFYSSSFKNEGIFPIEIKEGEVTSVRVDITYEAVF